jgi:hypothetical protein
VELIDGVGLTVKCIGMEKLIKYKIRWGKQTGWMDGQNKATDLYRCK